MARQSSAAARHHLPPVCERCDGSGQVEVDVSSRDYDPAPLRVLHDCDCKQEKPK